MKKNILTILLMFLCVLTICGCASVSYSEIQLSDGSIKQEIYVNLDKTKIESAGLQVGNVITDIGIYAQACYNNMLNNFKQNVADEQIKLQVTQNQSFQIVPSQNAVAITLTFNDLDTYKYFYNHSLESTGSEPDIVDYTFYEQNNYTSESQFHDLENNSIANYWLQYFTAHMPNVSYNDCTYIYCYSTPHQKIHSDAYMVYQDEYSNYSHLWYFTGDDLTGENAHSGGIVNLYTISIKSPIWYFVAIGATALLIAGLSIYCVIKDKKQKQAKVDGSNATFEIK